MGICDATYYSVQKQEYDTSTSMAVKSIFRYESPSLLRIKSTLRILRITMFFSVFFVSEYTKSCIHSNKSLHLYHLWLLLGTID